LLKINRNKSSLSFLESPSLTESSITERYDLQEFIYNSPSEFFKEFGEELFVLGKEQLPSDIIQDRIDLLALDREGTCVIIELKRGSNKLQMLQAISYAGMISHWLPEDFLKLLDENKKEELAEFLEGDFEDINRGQRIILVAEAYDYALLVGAEWLSEFGVEISCCKVALATDPETNSEYLVCSNVYPIPELVTVAVSRGHRGVKHKVQWSDWESALSNIANKNVKEFFESEIVSGRSFYLRKRSLKYLLSGRDRWSVTARQNNAYVWQVGRFENDIQFWKDKITNVATVKSVKDGKCLRMNLESKSDFENFFRAASNELLSVNWLDVTDEVM
jgi:hypothetical protein